MSGLSNTDEETSFPDDKLYQLNEQFRSHVARCEERFNSTDEKFERLIQAQQASTEAHQANAEAISHLVKEMTLVVQETRGIVQLDKDIRGAARIGKGLQSFMSWVVKWPLIGTGLYAMVTWVVKHFPSS